MATLPGVRTTIEDRFYNATRTDIPGGPLVCVVAKRNNAATSTAPSLTPYFATSEKTVIEEFGQNSQIHKAYYELSTGGASRISFVALPSDTVFTQNTGTITSATAAAVGDLFAAALAAVEAARADIVVLWGAGSSETDWDDVATPATPAAGPDDFFYADNSSTAANSWVKKLADACSSITVNSHPIIGILGVKGIVGQEIPTTPEVASGLAFANLPNKNSFNPAVGHLVSVIAGEIHVIGAPTSWGYQNAACTYAAQVSRLDSWSSTTNKVVFNVDRLRYNPTRTQLESMIGKGLAPIQIDMQRQLRWVDGTTYAADNSDYTRLTTIRIVFDAVKLVRQRAQTYIGETMSIENQQSFHSQVSSALQSMQKLGALNNADFRIQYTPSDNKAVIDLALVPAFELREIYIQVSVNF